MWRSNQLSYRTGKDMPRMPKGNRPPLWENRKAARSRIRKQTIQDTTKTSAPERRCSLIGLACAEPHQELLSEFFRKEVFQPHLPVRLPCYDLAPITSFTLGRSLRSRTSGTPGFHGLTGGVYKARERIHRAMADARLLANPASWGRVADPNPN